MLEQVDVFLITKRGIKKRTEKISKDYIDSCKSITFESDWLTFKPTRGKSKRIMYPHFLETLVRYSRVVATGHSSDLTKNLVESYYIYLKTLDHSSYALFVEDFEDHYKDFRKDKFFVDKTPVIFWKEVYEYLKKSDKFICEDSDVGYIFHNKELL